MNNDYFPTGVDLETGRIFQGENYNLLPYIILDYPKMFGKNAVFSFRTMFWWGKNFSFTLHLEGESLDMYRNNIIKNISKLTGKGYYFCINNSPWEYHFNQDNYLPIEKIENPDVLINSKSFLKLSRKLELDQWESVPSFAKETFILLMEVIK